ncbi:MAG: phosphate ABC transporter permease PstA [Coriobacteriia bacterium]|nr:phosphate ABC transporter permease PstA [Coriobacteriia bacterium]
MRSDHHITRPRRLSTRIGPAAAWLAAGIVAAVCFFIVGYLIYEGIQYVDWTFLTTDPEPSLVEEAGGGIRIPIVGTTVLVLLSTLLTVPIALGAAVYLAEYMDERKPLTKSIRLGLEVLAGVPSVVFGMFGVAMFSHAAFTFMSSAGAEGADAAFGRSFFVAATVMAIHVLPFVIKVMEEAVRSVPASYRHGAAALGVTKWRAIRRVILPAASPGLMTAVILGMGLAAGDTAIVWLTLGGTMSMAVDNWWAPEHILTVIRGTGSTLTTFTYFSSPAGEGNAPGLAYGAAMVLMLLVVTLNAAATLIGRFAKKTR